MNRRLPTYVRRLVLGGALLAATLLALAPQAPAVRAAEPPPGPLVVVQADPRAAADAARDAAREASAAAREAAAAAKAAAREARRQATDAAAAPDTAGDAAGDGHRKGITIGISGTDREYDSFDQFLDRDPWLATMVIGVVFVVFLTPILLVALVVWYKMRKTRLQNETMVKLAERGALPPAEAMQAVVGGRADAAIAATAVPLAEQARTLRRAAAWSDLRRGVLLGAIGFATTLYSMMDDGTANWLGLALLFVGIGYCALWYFEDRQVSTGQASPAPGPGPGDGRN